MFKENDFSYFCKGQLIFIEYPARVTSPGGVFEQKFIHAKVSKMCKKNSILKTRFDVSKIIKHFI